MRLIVLLLLVVLQAVPTSTERKVRDRLLSNEEASCPRGCTCTRTDVICRQKKFRDSSVFLQIHEKAFPHMDTLIMTGNSFDDLSDSLFTEGESHAGLTLVNLTDNNIRKISPETFKGAPKIEYLHLSNNNIMSAGKNPFGILTELELLEMNGALGRRSADSKADLMALLFESDRPAFHRLAEIKLQKNDISILHKTTFCKLIGVRRLDLSNNSLSSFDVDDGCLQTLEALDLSNNKFTTFTDKFWDTMKSLTTFDISGNPLECDCKIQSFWKNAQKEKTSFANQGKTFCAGPPNRKGQNFFEMTGDLCNDSGYGIGTFILLVLVACGVLFAYRHYRSRLPPQMPFHMGYSGLEADDDNARPEFV